MRAWRSDPAINSSLLDQRGIANRKELIDHYQEKIYLLRQEIKKGLIGKIVMRPTLCKSDQRASVAEVNADPPSL